MEQRNIKNLRIIRLLIANTGKPLTKYKIAKLTNCSRQWVIEFLRNLESKKLVKGIKVTDEPFNPRGPIEITSSGQLKIKQNVSRTGERGSYFSGPFYIYRCATCHRLFKKRNMDSTLRSHKNKNGYTCSGSYGFYVRTKF